MQEKKIPLIVIVGPTASGKTALSIELAKKFDAEIVSADSMQVYKEMDIATAKPTDAEMQGIPHHLIGCVDIDEKYSVAQYLDDARRVIDGIISRGKRVILVGGTGLYINSLVDNIQFEPEEKSDELREKLKRELDERGGEYMLGKLIEVDPEYAARLHPNDGVRIIRALEINKIFGHTMGEHKELSKKVRSPYDALMLGINYQDRQKLYDRIDHRVDIMIEQGLVDEAKCFFGRFDSSKTAVQAIGYKELFPFLKGYISLEEAVDNLKRATRNYAKRQLTWFRKDQRINWLYADVLSQNEVFDRANELCKEFFADK